LAEKFRSADQRKQPAPGPYVYLARIIATFLDSAFVLPGTSIRIGLDPLIGLIPGFGDSLAGLLGTSLLFLGAQVGMPRIVLARMGLNVFLNTAIGIIPGIGDLFSFWFKSNMRNLALIHRYTTEEPRRVSTTADWIFVIGMIVLMLALFVLVILGALWLVRRAWDFVA
jgi:hypothetical protein